MIRSLRRPLAVSHVLATAALAVAMAACSGSATNTNVAANTANDSAHVAGQANEQRTNDPTAAQARPITPAPTTATTTSVETTAARGAPAVTPATARPRSETTPTKIGARHVLIQWMGSDRAGKSVLRTKEQAQALAQEVLKRAKSGDDLGRLAVEYSDEPNAGARGGSLGRFGKGQMVGAFERTAFQLDVGELSDIVETPFGFHIIQRTE